MSSVTYSYEEYRAFQAKLRRIGPLILAPFLALALYFTALMFWFLISGNAEAAGGCALLLVVPSGLLLRYVAMKLPWLLRSPPPVLNLELITRVVDGKLLVGIRNTGNVEAPLSELIVYGGEVLKTQPLNIMLRPGEKTVVEVNLGGDIVFARKVAVRLEGGEVFEASVDH